MKFERDPEDYVEKNAEQLSYIITDSNYQFVRGLCPATLVKCGSDTDIDRLKEQPSQL